MKNLIKSLFLILIYGSLVFGAIVGIKALYEKINYQFCEKCDYVEEVTIEPTCISSGEKKRTCKVCGHFEVETIQALEHVYSEAEIINATCEEYGSKTFECESCHVTYIEEIAPYGHQLLDPSHAELIYEAKNCEEQNIYKLICLNKDCDYFEEYKGRFGDCEYEVKYDENGSWLECIWCNDIPEDVVPHLLTNKIEEYSAKNCSEKSYSLWACSCQEGCNYTEKVYGASGDCIYDDTFAPEKWMCAYCYYETTDEEEVNKLFGLYISTRYVGTTAEEMVTSKITVKTGNLYFIYVTFDKICGKISLTYNGEIITKDNATWINDTNLFFDASVDNYTLINDRTGSYCITYDYVNNIVSVMYN